MNRRDFLRRSLYLGLALGLPAGVAVAGTCRCGGRVCGGVVPDWDTVRARARMQLAQWWKEEIDRLAAHIERDHGSV